MKRMITLLNRFHRAQGGSAMTEFVMTLPVWLIIMYLIWDIGFVHMRITSTQIEAQTKMWAAVIPLTQPFDPVSGQTPSGDQAQYMVPALGANKAREAEMRGRNAHNGRGTFTNIEGGVHAASILGVGGSLSGMSFGAGDSHYVESAYRMGALSAGLSGVPTAKLKAKDVTTINQDRRYPVMMLNDGLDLNFNFSGNSTSAQVAGLLMSVLDSSGAIHSIAAGARYGAVMGNHKGQYTGIGGWSVEPDYTYDVLVSPAPYNTDAANYVPMMLARLGAEAAEGEKYAVALRFCKGDWSGSTPAGNSTVDPDRYREDAEDSSDVQEAEDCESDGFGSVEQCRSCRANSCSSSACPGYNLCSCNPSHSSCQPPSNP